MQTAVDEGLRKVLSEDEVGRFHTDGYLGPFTAVEPDSMSAIRSIIESDVLNSSGLANSPLQSRHLDRRCVYDLVSHPNIVDRVADLMGPDIVLWRSNIFNKEAGQPTEIPWHQDFKYWPIEPPINISAWIAIDEVTVENSCVQLIPGSHLDIVPHIPAIPGQEFAVRADPSGVDTGRALNMELRPGEFFLFVERLLHHSEPNHSAKRRMGIAARFTVPFVRVDHDRLFPKHRAILVRGTDKHGLNKYGVPPDTRRD